MRELVKSRCLGLLLLASSCTASAVDATDASSSGDAPDASACGVGCTSEDTCRGQVCATEGMACDVAPSCAPYQGRCTCTSGRWVCTSTDCPRRDS